MYRSILEKNRSLYGSLILVIDDSQLSRKITEKLLLDEGFDNIIFSENGKKALGLLEENIPKLIVCDLFMPEMDGYEFTKAVRNLEKHKNTPIIIQTSANSPEDINNAYLSEASDLIFKPTQREEFFTKIVFHLENATYRTRVKEELESARLMQESIIPDDDDIRNLEEIYNLEIASQFSPSSEVGGDFWGLKKVSHNEIAIFNVDLSGHGVAAALNTFRVSSLIEDRSNIFASPEVMLRKINKRMKEFMPMGQFATMFYGVIDIENNILKYSGAGCPPPLIMRKDSNIETLDTKGVPLGIIEESEYKESTTSFSKGDILVTFSDALIETPNDHEEFFDHKKLEKTLSKTTGLDAKETLSKINKRFLNFIGKNDITDDLTINVIKR